MAPTAPFQCPKPPPKGRARPGSRHHHAALFQAKHVEDVDQLPKQQAWLEQSVYSWEPQSGGGHRPLPAAPGSDILSLKRPPTATKTLSGGWRTMGSPPPNLPPTPFREVVYDRSKTDSAQLQNLCKNIAARPAQLPELRHHNSVSESTCSDFLGTEDSRSISSCPHWKLPACIDRGRHRTFAPPKPHPETAVVSVCGMTLKLSVSKGKGAVQAALAPTPRALSASPTTLPSRAATKDQAPGAAGGAMGRRQSMHISSLRGDGEVEGVPFPFTRSGTENLDTGRDADGYSYGSRGDGPDAEGRRVAYLKVFDKIKYDGEAHKDMLVTGLELCGFDRPNRLWIEQIMNGITKFSTLEASEFLVLVETYSQKQRASQIDAFNRCDSDGSGLVEMTELRALFQSFGLDPPRYVLDEAFAEVDVDQDGAIDVDEFQEVMEILHVQDGFTKQEYKSFMDVFRSLVRDEDEIECEKMAGVLDYLNFALDAKSIERIVREVDIDQSGKLNSREYLMCLRKVQQKEVQSMQAAVALVQMEGPSDVPFIRASDVEGILVRLGYTVPQVGAYLEAALELGYDLSRQPVEVDDFWRVLAAWRRRERLTNEDLVEIDKVFLRYDKTGTGFISTLDVGKALRCLGWKVLFEVQQGLIRRVDVEESRKLACWQLRKLVRLLQAWEIGTLEEVWRKNLLAGERLLSVAHVSEIFFNLGYLEASTKETFQVEPSDMSVPGSYCKQDMMDMTVFLKIGCRLTGVARTNFKNNGGFSPNEVQHMQEYFQQCDGDGSGDISNRELITLIEEIFPAMASDPAMRPQLLEIMREADADGSGSLDFQDFMNLMKQLRDLQDHERAVKELQAITETGFCAQEVSDFRELFMCADRTHTGGHITLEQATDMIGTITPLNDRYKADFQNIFQHIVHTHQGTDTSREAADFPEFLWLMKALLSKNFANLVERTRSFGQPQPAKPED